HHPRPTKRALAGAYRYPVKARIRFITMYNGTHLKPAIRDCLATNINDTPEVEITNTTTVDEDPTIVTTVSKVSPQSSKKQTTPHSISAASVASPGSRKSRHAE